MTYDYRRAMASDIKDAIENYDMSEYSNMDEVSDFLYDAFWVDDSVTGNGSGSYTFSREQARGYVQGNEDLLVDAIEEFGGGGDQYKRALTDPEYADVTIRCYLLGEVLWEALEDPLVKKYILKEIGQNGRSDNRKSKKTAKKKAPRRR